MVDTNKLVAVVTGASRGIGKGVALELGQRGATVYVVGRTTAGMSQVSAGGRPVPGSIDKAAAEVTAAGGHGIAVACDMSKDDDIQALFERVKAESGHLNILVNNAASLHEDMGKRPFWEAPIKLADIIDVGLRCHQVATYYAAPLLVAGGRGLVVNISFYSDAKIHDPAYYAAKAGLDQLAASWSEDFVPRNVAAISLWPGFVRTERGEEMLGDKKEVFEGMGMESPRYEGRIIGAVWDDPEMMALAGKTVIGAELGERYGVTDLPGFHPKSLREFYGPPHPRFDLE
ncbi:SDR family NAD(P)-dependent oxidoreductase [Archangium primigenium]|uniref:SDR family NAD(P)-dependent oxidoreductase n=1 Tax=[Archangium] primigenium TaxID=2792470 RepID=UPI0019562210|nr:SDR family NAD(P)-dependent oxidoreductase [Archangium primigenium]MBM7114351.1 SDR family NAD(P)-dependent oxidoreductase [Archangium primigenium]